MELTIDKEGRVADLQLIKRSSLFNEAAMQAVRQWQYKPYEVKGEPQPFATTVTLNFVMDSAPQIPQGSQ
jgi:protein TonB